jgi:rhodanese-related sulfurtransferase
LIYCVRTHILLTKELAMSVITITREELAEKIEHGGAVVVEALPRSYWEDGHLPGAVNLPHDADDATIVATLPDRARAVAVYCANAACPNSGILARRLVQLGYTDVAAYEGGKQDWIEAGLALEVPAAV